MLRGLLRGGLRLPIGFGKILCKRDLIRVMGEDIIWEKLQSVGGENLKLMST